MTLNQANATYSFDELAIWRTKLPQARHAVLPPSNNRPNPLVTETMVYVSVFSPGLVYALDRRTGKIVWRREIPRFGGSSLCLGQGKLFAKTANTVFAFEPKTGKTIWSFCPYGDSGESIYSAPTLYGNRVFIGDRRGYLHCLDSRTGETCWKQRTNRAKNCDLNSTPVVSKGLVIVSTNAKTAVAYNPKTGRKVWARKLDGPSAFGPLLCRDLLVVVTDSIYLLRPESGRIVRKFSWKQDGVTQAESTDRNIVVSLRDNSAAGGIVKLVGLSKNGIHFTETCEAWVAFLHYATETKLMYVSHLKGIDLRRPESGVMVSKIERSNGLAENSPVDVKRNTIYVLTSDGYVYALRHPALPGFKS